MAILNKSTLRIRWALPQGTPVGVKGAMKFSPLAKVKYRVAI